MSARSGECPHRRRTAGGVDPPRVPADAVGVGSNNEDPLPAMASANGGRRKHTPLRIEPEAGQVSKYGAKCPHNCSCAVSHTPRAGLHVAISGCVKETWDIFEHHQTGTERVDCADDLGPQPSPGARPEPRASPGHRHVLAGEARQERVDGWRQAPVHGRDVAQVGDVRVAVGQDRGGVADLPAPPIVLGDVRDECQLGGGERLPERHVQPAVPGEQRPDRQHGAPPTGSTGASPNSHTHNVSPSRSPAVASPT